MNGSKASSHIQTFSVSVLSVRLAYGPCDVRILDSINGQAKRVARFSRAFRVALRSLKIRNIFVSLCQIEGSY